MLACAGYLLTMLADVVIGIVANRNSSDQVKVEVEEGRIADDKEVETGHSHTSPYFIRTSTVGDTILLIVALCFHSIFEGIAVGIACMHYLKLMNQFLVECYINKLVSDWCFFCICSCS